MDISVADVKPLDTASTTYLTKLELLDLNTASLSNVNFTTSDAQRASMDEITICA